MTINKEFAELHREMEKLVEWKDRGATWASPEQRTASEMVVRILWSLANNKEVSKVGLEFLQEEMAKLGPG